jgi:hypothetical protein
LTFVRKTDLKFRDSAGVDKELRAIQWLKKTVQQEQGIIRSRIFQDLLESRASYLIPKLFQNAEVQAKRHCVPEFPTA